MPGCKVGDLVVVINTDSPEHNRLLGMTGTVLARDDCFCSKCQALYAGIPMFNVNLPGSRTYTHYQSDVVFSIPDKFLQPIRPPGIIISTKHERELEYSK